jgi:membrane protein DedA with SNARE-associated domain
MNYGLPVFTALLVAMEAGVPIPVPSDVLLLVLGERASAGRFPLLLVILAVELVAAVGTAALFFAVRGPGRALLDRFGPRLGLTPDRLDRATGLLERRGIAALLVGRATPGLRTVTVVAAGGSTLAPGRALPPLVLGSSVFVQLHLALGYFLGPAARDALDSAKGPMLVLLALVALGGVVVWVRRRGARRGLQSSGEACCPACLALGALAPKAFSLSELA